MKDLFNKVSEKVSETRGSVMDAVEKGISLDALSEKFSGMTDAAREKSAAFTNDLISLSPIIEEIGFKTNGITINMGLPPDVTFHFEKFKDIDTVRKDEILAQHKNKLMLSTIVKALMGADSFQDKLKLGTFRFSTIDLCIGLTPGVSIQLVPKKIEFLPEPI
jgi:hypothetical protein